MLLRFRYIYAHNKDTEAAMPPLYLCIGPVLFVSSVLPASLAKQKKQEGITYSSSSLIGSRSVKVLPWPTALFTEILPP